MFKCVILISSAVFINCNLLQIEISKEMLKKGEEMYEMILKHKSGDGYGQCWYDAVKDIDTECSNLSQELQIDLAMRFANCFLEMTEQVEIPCAAERKPNLRKICFEAMNDRMFLTFTEFYTHSQNICYFLRNQLWHKETEQTIEMLGSISKHVAFKLAMAKEQQEKLLVQQKIGLELQRQIFQHGVELSQTLLESRKNLELLTEEFRTTTYENNQIFMNIFARISSIQSWILGEYSLLNCIAFFVGLTTVAIILTSSNRTSSSRFPLLATISLNILVEYFIRLYMLSMTNYDLIEQDKQLSSITWIIRKMFISVAVIIFAFKVFKFTDLNERNNRLLNDLQRQNLTLSSELMEIKGLLVNPRRRRSALCFNATPIEEEVSFALEMSRSLGDIEDDFEEFPERVSQRASTPIEFLSSRYNLRNRSESRLSIKKN